jgi:hypothetical protein
MNNQQVRGAIAAREWVRHKNGKGLGYPQDLRAFSHRTIGLPALQETTKNFAGQAMSPL